MSAATLPTDAQARKDIPIMRGVLDYFPAALAYVAKVSKAGNDKHNPGEDMHHARGKSSDHADCAVRHLIDRGTIDPDDNLRHTGKAAWRILAELQEELEREEGAPLARGARLPVEAKPKETYVQRLERRKARARRVYPGMTKAVCGDDTCKWCAEFDA